MIRSASGRVPGEERAPLRGYSKALDLIRLQSRISDRSSDCRADPLPKVLGIDLAMTWLRVQQLNLIVGRSLYLQCTIEDDTTNGRRSHIQGGHVLLLCCTRISLIVAVHSRRGTARK